MIQIRLDPTSTQQVCWPTRDAEIIALGKTVLAAEQALPLERRFPRVEVLQTRLASATEVQTAAEDAEATRTAEAYAAQASFETAKTLTRRAINALTLKYVHVALLEAWGVEVVGTGSQFRIHVPKRPETVIHMLDRYITKEGSLSPEQRIPLPTLAEVTAARDALVSSQTQRKEALTAREVANNQREEAAQFVLRLIQLVALYHTVIDYGALVDPTLQTLGYRVVTRSSPSPNAPSPNGTPETPPESQP